jgi:hypothetical protein
LGIILHLDETLDLSAQIVIRDRRLFEPIAKDVTKGPAKANGCFEIKNLQEAFPSWCEMNDPPVGSAESGPVRQAVLDVDLGWGKLCKDAAAEM